MSGRFAIVADASATIPAELERELGIRRIPLHVAIAGAEVDMPIDDFYRVLADKRAAVTTSQPSPGDCEAAYAAAVRGGHDGILVLTLAHELSGTYAVAHAAARAVATARVEVVDTRSAIGGAGLIATACARARARGAGLDEAIALARRIGRSVRCVATIDTLEQLARSGRVPAVQALVGGLLSVKPVLEIADGAIALAGRVRTRARSLAQLRSVATERFAPGGRLHFAAVYTRDAAPAEELLAWASERFECGEAWTAECGPVVGSHVGPGLVGICGYRDADGAPA